jgi:hypothetical protein
MIVAAVWALGLSVLIVADIIGNNLYGGRFPACARSSSARSS